MRISDWSADVCSSDLKGEGGPLLVAVHQQEVAARAARGSPPLLASDSAFRLRMGKTQGIRLRSNPPRSAPTRAMRRTSPETACVAKEGAAALSVAGADSIIVGDGSWSACASTPSLVSSPSCVDGCGLGDGLAHGGA